jgi:hypothetical protein
MLSDDLRRSRRRKNIVLAAILFALVALFYVISIVKMTGVE